ncbi:MAG: enoyl-CoA hydratase [Actinomycetia bacterium]|nr:enoyl-CoA hydratase [Actinomycetes bacterium]MCP4958203.1 enoyl-CoA hydratase [Actinomycetes bacterium]
MAGNVTLNLDGTRATITLDHPERHNAISREMWSGLFDAANTIAATPDVRVVILRGAGEKAFASGADISQFSEHRSDGNANTAYDDTTAAATSALARLPMPVIAAIHGFCLGGGLAVALTADIRIAADDGLFAIPAARLGLGYNVAGIANLMSLVGPSNAKEILFTATRFTASQALDMGIVNEVVAKEELEERVDELAGSIAGNAPLTIRSVKLAVRELTKPESQRDLTDVIAAIDQCFESDDYREGVAAFGEKRPPEFRGV